MRFARCPRTVLVSVLFAALSSAQTTFPEVEPNSVKPEATPVVGMTSGDMITGSSTSATAVPGSTVLASADVFRIKTAPLLLGIYRHVLTTTGATPFFQNRIGGLVQSVGVITTTDTFVQQSNAQQNCWYAFGKQEEIYYEVRGASFTTASYQAQLSTTPVNATLVPGPYFSGPITVTTVGSSGNEDTEIYVYDSNLDPIPLGHHDGTQQEPEKSTVTLTLAPGTYFVACGLRNMANNISDLAPTEAIVDLPLLDFPGAMTTSFIGGGQLATCRVTDGVTTNWFTFNMNANFKIEWGRFDVLPSAQPPPNDACVNATPLSVATSGTTTLATNDGAASCDPGGTTSRDVWYSVTNTAAVPRLLRVHSCNTFGIDPLLSAYSTCGGLELACNDSASYPCTGASRVDVPVAAGESILIRMSDKGQASGNFTIEPSWHPLHDSCAHPLQLLAPGTYPFDTTIATTQEAGQQESLCSIGGFNELENDLWFRYMATTNGTIRVTTCGLLVPSGPFGKSSKIAVYAANTCPAQGSAIVCNDTSSCTSPGASESNVTFQAVCGQAYLIEIGSIGLPFSAVGQFALTATGTPCSTPTTAFCTGNTPGTTCTGCGNNGSAGRGCANSLSVAGGWLTSTGTASIGADTLVLRASDVLNACQFFQASGVLGSPVMFGDGMFCAGIGVLRLGLQNPTSSFALYPNAASPFPIHILSGSIQPGDTRHYQCWYRDSASFCTSATFNLTNGIALTWAP